MGYETKLPEFDIIAAENPGYAGVVLEKTLAAGDDVCAVLVYPAKRPESKAAKSGEYYRSSSNGG